MYKKEKENKKSARNESNMKLFFIFNYLKKVTI